HHLSEAIKILLSFADRWCMCCRAYFAWLGAFFLWIGLIGSAKAQSEAAPGAGKAANLTEMSNEQLLSINVKVTSASRKSEDLKDAPSAIFVITAEDIRRGGFSSLPEALRMVPGLYVAK